MLRRTIFIPLAILMSLAAKPGFAEDALPTDTFKSIISHQLQAIAKDDAATAYEDAAPLVRQLFQTPDIFMNMVRSGYPPVYRNKQFVFDNAGTNPNGRPYQKVELFGLDGTMYDAIYYMQQQPDGTWKISGCVVAKAEGQTA